jgi:hypothetical protein
MSNYKYWTAGSPTYLDTPKNEYISAFQALLSEQFKLSPTYQIIKEEKVFGSGSFVDVDVRINRAINSQTSTKLGDDFKQILFPDLDHATGLGYLYWFSDNYWVTIFSEIIMNVGASCLVRRCNNLLRWIDENGKVYSEVVALEYEVSRPRDQTLKDMVLPSGYVTAFCQSNDRTKTLKPNQRFLFGPASNRVSLKIFGTGIRSFLNQKTMDDESANLLQLTMGGNYENEDNDNLTLGIANYYKYAYILSLSPTSISGSAGNIYQISPTLTLNGTQTIKPINFISSSSSVTTTGSGLISLISTGSSIITAYMVDNTSASASINVTVSGSSPVGYEVRVDPIPSYILEGDTTTYTCYLYNGGLIQADTFVFTASGSVPANHYTLSTISGNSFSIKNIEKYLSDNLTITCTSGSYVKNVDMSMKGAW